LLKKAAATGELVDTLLASGGRESAGFEGVKVAL
jgi:hypothetical protein